MKKREIKTEEKINKGKLETTRTMTKKKPVVKMDNDYGRQIKTMLQWIRKKDVNSETENETRTRMKSTGEIREKKQKKGKEKKKKPCNSKLYQKTLEPTTKMGEIFFPKVIIHKRMQR